MNSPHANKAISSTMQCIGLFTFKTIKRHVIEDEGGEDEESGFLPCMIMRKTCQGKHKMFCIRLDESTVHLQSPFFQHHLKLEPCKYVIESSYMNDLVSASASSSSKPKKTRKKSKNTLHDDMDVIVNDKEVLLDDESSIRVIDTFNLIEYFDGIIYKLIDWIGYAHNVKAHGATDRKIADTVKHTFYYLNLLSSLSSSSESSSSPQITDNKTHLDEFIDTIYPYSSSSSSSLDYGSFLSVLWYHDKDSMKKLKEWLKTFKSICIEGHITHNFHEEQTKLPKNDRYWDSLYTPYYSTIEELDEILDYELQTRNQQYINDDFDPNDSQEQQEQQDDPIKRKNPKSPINYYSLSNIIKSLKELKPICSSLLSCVGSIERIFQTFNIIQLKCITLKRSLTNELKNYKVNDMNEFQLSDLSTFIHMMDYAYHGGKIPNFTFKVQDNPIFNDYVELIDKFIGNNLHHLMSLSTGSLKYLSSDMHLDKKDFQRNVNYMVILRYIIHKTNKLAFNTTQLKKSSVYSTTLKSILDKISFDECDTCDNDKIGSFIKFFDKNHEGCLSFTVDMLRDVINDSFISDCTKVYPIHNPYQWVYHPDKHYDGDHIREKECIKHKYYVTCFNDEVRMEKNLYLLLKSNAFNTSSSIQLRVISSDHEEDQNEHDYDGGQQHDMIMNNDNDRVYMKLMVYNSVDIMNNLDLNHFYDHYYQYNLNNTLVIRPHMNYHVNKNVYDFFMKKDALKSAFYKERHCVTASNISSLKGTNYGYIFIPYAHLYSTHDYYNVLKFIDKQVKKKSLKSVIISGTIDCVPTCGFGQPFVDHLRSINPKFIIQPSSLNEVMFNDILNQYWFSEESHSLIDIYELNKNDTRKFFHTFLTSFIKKRKFSHGTYRTILLAKRFGHTSQFIKHLIDYTLSLFQLIITKKITKHVLKGNERVYIHHIDDKNNQLNLLEPIVDNKITFDKIKLQSNFYIRQTSLIEFNYHIHIYTINLSYLKKLSKNELMIIFTILDNLIIVDDTIARQDPIRNVDSHEEFKDYIANLFNENKQFILKSTYFDICEKK